MNGFIWNVDRDIPAGSQIIVGTDETLHVRAPDDTPIYFAKFGPGQDQVERDLVAGRARIAELEAENERLRKNWERALRRIIELRAALDADSSPVPHPDPIEPEPRQ